MSKIKGCCPRGCGETLFVSPTGHITCSWHQCPDPAAVTKMLNDPLNHEHVVTFTDVGFGIQHPLSERGDDLVGCELHRYISSLDGPPVQPGRYIARLVGRRWRWTSAQERSA